MFGFLRPARRQPAYRQVYAAYCSYQRSRYGLLAAPFTSYESVFLYLLAVDVGACPPLNPATPTCCRLRRDRANRWGLNLELADFCSAVAMILTRVKIEDDVTDNRSFVAAAIRRLFRRRFATAERAIERVAPGLAASLDECVVNHQELEQSGAKVGLEAYAQATADGFGKVFAAFSTLCARRLRQPIALAELGTLVGKSIIFADVVVDFESDQRKGTYNPIRNENDRNDAKHLALANLSRLLWSCSELAGESANSTQVVRDVYHRVAALRWGADAKPAQARARSRRRRLLQGGFCDCDFGLGDCAGECCMDAAGEGCAHGCGGCDCCDPSLFCGDCCGTGASKSDSNSNQSDSSSAANSELIGKVGVSIGPLNPSGIVLIEGREWPASTQHDWIDGGIDVEVQQVNSFGLTVKAI